MRRFCITLGMIALALSMFAQTPQQFSYQAVVRNEEGKLVSEESVDLIIAILQGNADGDAVYTETQTTTTNKNGLLSLRIGNGSSSDDFSAINWANGPYFLKTQIMVDGKAIETVSQLLAVPYALYAEKVANLPDMSNFVTKEELQNFSNTSNVASKDTLAFYITTKKLNDTLSYYVKSDELPAIPSVDGLASEEFVNEKVDGLATTAYVDEQVASKTNVQADWNEADEESDAYIKNKPAIPSVDGLASEEFVNEKVDGLATTTYVDGKVTGLATTTYVDGKVDGLATEDFVNEQVEGLATTTYVDGKVTGLATTTYVDGKVDGLATEDFVNEQVDGLATTTYVDGKVDGLATTTYVDGKVTGLATTTYVDGKVDGLATEDFVNEQVEGLATTTYVDGKVTGLATTAYVDEQVASKTNVQADWNVADEESDAYIKNKPAIPSVDGLASEEFVNEKVDGLATTAYVDEQVASKTNVQADWNVADEESDAYIKNKPTKVSDFENDAEYVTKAEYDELKESYDDLKASFRKQTLGMMCNLAPNTIYKGALLSKFSVGPDKQVVFSQGNLQYRRGGEHLTAEGTTVSGTWRFAEHQYDVVGGIDAKQKVNGKPSYIGGNVYYNGVKCDNIYSLDEDYEGWFDLFAYGTSGWNSGKEIYQPGQMVNGKTYPSKYINSIVNENKYADWGVYNAISNGGKTPEQWRVLSNEEWLYLLLDRPNAQDLFAPCTIHLDSPTDDGVEELYGFVLLPDDWSGCPAGCSFIHSTSLLAGEGYSYSGNFGMNEYTEAQWADMQSYGAVYIPGNTGVMKYKADYKAAYTPERDDDIVVTNTVYGNNSDGTYWTCTPGGYAFLYYEKTRIHTHDKDWAMSVRLVADVE